MHRLLLIPNRELSGRSCAQHHELNGGVMVVGGGSVVVEGCCSKGTCDLILWGISAAMEFNYSVEEPLTSACLLYYYAAQCSYCCCCCWESTSLVLSLEICLGIEIRVTTEMCSVLNKRSLMRDFCFYMRRRLFQNVLNRH